MRDSPAVLKDCVCRSLEFGFDEESWDLGERQAAARMEGFETFVCAGRTLEVPRLITGLMIMER